MANDNCTIAKGNADNDNAKILHDIIKVLEDKHLSEEWVNKKIITIPEEEYPSKNFLNIESRK